MTIKPSYKYHLLPTSRNEYTSIAHSSVNMPSLTLSGAIDLFLMYSIPIVGILILLAVQPEFLCVDDIRYPVLYASMLNIFIVKGFDWLLDWLYVSSVYGRHADRAHAETFQRWKSAGLYVASLGIAIIVSAMPLPRCSLSALP